MTTYTNYPTITKAVNNGTGDCFYTKDGNFIAISRKDSPEAYEAAGYTFLPWSQAMEIAKIELETKIAAKAILYNQVPQPTKACNQVPTCDGYYDEFPDAYGQSL